MIDRLVNFVRGIHHTIKKEDVLKNLDTILTGITVDVIPALDNIIKNSDLKVIKDSVILKNISTVSGINAKDNKTLFVKIKNIVSNINKEGKDLENVINDCLNDVMTDKTISVREGAILKVVTDISSISLYILDLSYLVLLEGNSENTDLPKITLDKIKKGSVTFSNLLKNYGKNFGKTVDNLKTLPENSLYVSNDKITMLSKLVSKDTKTLNIPSTNGFIGNPIYSIKMWMVDREIAKYEALKEKRKLIELKLVELRLNEKDGESNPSLTKRIEYYEDKLAKIEYDIAQTEDDDDE